MNKASVGFYLYHFDDTFSRIQWVWSLNKTVDSRFHDFHVYSDCELMKNIKVIQHIHGIEHITDKLLQTKSLEFTYESLVIFEASLTLIVADEMIYLCYNFSRGEGNFACSSIFDR
jgi:hypothetical protein